MDERQIPTGRRLDVAGTPQDFRTFRAFRPGIGADFNRIRDFRATTTPSPRRLAPRHPRRGGHAARSALGRTVTVLTSHERDGLHGQLARGGCPETKSGGRYRDHAGVALECQNLPDAVNRPEFPSPLLHPGELYCQKTVYRFGIL